MNRLLIINNVPTPYRVFLFNRLWAAGADVGVAVEVAYQAERIREHPGWDPWAMTQHVPFWIARRSGLHGARVRPWFDRRTLHWDILRAVVSGRYDAVLCSPFMGSTGALIALLPMPRMRRLLWSENNRLSSGASRPLLRRFKRLLTKRFDAIVVPGVRAAEHLYELNPGLEKRLCVMLPNLVDRTVFGRRVQALRAHRDLIRRDLGLPSRGVVILSIGQMEDRKGFVNSIDAMLGSASPAVYCLLGSGSRLSSYRERVARAGGAERIRLPGDLPEAQVVRYFAAADWFWHPALADPSPLVCVEALTAGLPLSVSIQTGNAPETVDEARNGLLFDGFDANSVAAALATMIALPESVRETMGLASAQLAAERFDPDRVCRRFFSALRKVTNAPADDRS